MQLRLRTWMILLGTCGAAFCQQLAFTSRTYVQSPVVVTSVEASKEFGFDSVAIRNDGASAVSAVHFQITFRTGAGDEIADERRVAVGIERRDTRLVVVDLGHIEGLKQLARSRKQDSALVILTIESVEFQDGGEWKQAEREHGTPIDPVQAPAELNRRPK
jgi:hypothetical protein